MDYRERALPFMARGLPTSQPGGMKLLFTEQFDVLARKQTAQAYQSAMQWPDGWVPWDPHARLVSDLLYADAAMQCGVIAGAEAPAWGGMLRAWPKLDDLSLNAWVVYARVGCVGGRPANILNLLDSAGDPYVPLNGLLVSTTDLVASPTADGPFVVTGKFDFLGTHVSAFTDSVTPTFDAGLIPIVQTDAYVQLVLLYDGISDTTQLFCSAAGDGIGYMSFEPGTGENPPPTSFTLPGRPKALGLAQAVGAGAGAVYLSRMDYVAVFGAESIGEIASEGARGYY